MSNIFDVCRELPEKSFNEGESIIHEGTIDGCLYFLKEGSVEILKKGVTINTISSPGALLGEISFLLDRPHIASVKTLEPCVFYFCDDPLKFLTEHPEANIHIARMLANRLSAVTDYLVELTDQADANKDELGVADAVLKSIMQHYSTKAL